MTDQPLTVIEALNAVAEEIGAVAKNDRNDFHKFNFRGIDAVTNAVNPALRKHGVVVAPVRTHLEHEEVASKNGTKDSVYLTVTYRWYGPQGDFIDTEVVGAAMDAGDKAVPKAHSVAFRTAMLQTLTLPTDDEQPDAVSHERASRQPSSGPPPEQAPAPNPAPETYSKDTFRKRFHATLGDLGISDEAKYAWLAKHYGHESTNDFSDDERRELVKLLGQDGGKDRLKVAMERAAAEAEANADGDDYE